VWFEGQHIDEMCAYFAIFICNVDIVCIHDTFYVSVIIVRVRSGQEVVCKFHSFMRVLFDRKSRILQFGLEILGLRPVLCDLKTKYR